MKIVKTEYISINYESYVNFLCTCGFSLVLGDSSSNNIGDFNTVFLGHPVHIKKLKL